MYYHDDEDGGEEREKKFIALTIQQQHHNLENTSKNIIWGSLILVKTREVVYVSLDIF